MKIAHAAVHEQYERRAQEQGRGNLERDYDPGGKRVERLRGKSHRRSYALDERISTSARISAPNRQAKNLYWREETASLTTPVTSIVIRSEAAPS